MSTSPSSWPPPRQGGGRVSARGRRACQAGMRGWPTSWGQSRGPFARGKTPGRPAGRWRGAARAWGRVGNSARTAASSAEQACAALSVPGTPASLWSCSLRACALLRAQACSASRPSEAASGGVKPWGAGSLEDPTMRDAEETPTGAEGRPMAAGEVGPWGEESPWGPKTSIAQEAPNAAEGRLKATGEAEPEGEEPS